MHLGSALGDEVENWIERPCVPKRLFLAWQPADLAGDRFRWAVGQLEPEGFDCTLRYFGRGAEFDALNPSHTYDELLRLGYPGYPAFPLKREVHREGVLSAFMRRLPPRSRPDFAEYASQFRLRPDSRLSDFALLGLTEAKLPSDGFSLVDPLDVHLDFCELMLEVAGYRHYVGKLPLTPRLADPVEMLPEPSNPYDRNAVQICLSEHKIGYVNRLQAGTFLQWISERRISACIERLNGDPGRPRAFVFVRIRPPVARVAA
jgi:hypothetical protein